MISNTEYEVPVLNKKLDQTVSVPGSKSMTNRALLLAALAKGVSVLKGVQFSDDSRHFLQCLQSLGFHILIEEELHLVTVHGENGLIPKPEAEIDVGSAGTAARFLTAMLAFSSGTYTITCSEQMKKRPMKSLFQALQQSGASFKFLEKENSLPVVVTGSHAICHDMTMDISESTQFLSALLLTSPMLRNGMKVKITSEKKDGAYIRITRNMLEEWGIKSVYDQNCYQVPANQKLTGRNYEIEPDVSAACYFYAAAAITGGSITVSGVHADLMQGDMKFLNLLKQMECQVIDTAAGIRVTGPSDGYHGVDVDMNDYSDQALTLAAMAPYAKTPTIIRNIEHIRHQESDRIRAITENLSRAGIHTEETESSVKIYPGKLHGALIETFEDHRVAMAFSLLGLKTPGIRIGNPQCCAKTFEQYFEVFHHIIMT